jgi:regulatory protein
MKGIDDGTVNKAMGVIDETEYLHILRELIKAKRKSIRGKSDYEVNGKLIRFAIGRGFEFAAIRSCMDVDENYDDSEGWD